MPNPPSTLRQTAKQVLLFVIIPLLLIALFFVFRPPNVADEAARFERDENGQLVRVKNDDDSSSGVSANFEAQAAKIAATNSLGSFSSVSASAQARFASRHLAIFNLSDHLLLKRIARHLIEQFKQQSYIDRLEYYPAGKFPKPGGRAPDVFLTLDLESLDESGMLVSRKLKAKIQVTAGTRFADSHHSYSDHLTPPLINFSWTGTLDHESTTTGVQTASAKYKLAAQNIAKQFADGLVKQFKQWQVKRGELPKLPDDFYPVYREPQPLPFLDQVEAQQVFAGHGLMNHNQSCWRFVSQQEPNELLRSIHQQLGEAGWKVGELKPDQKLSHLRVTSGSAVVEVFDGRQEFTPPTAKGVGDDATPKSTTYFVRYLDRMTQDELQQAVETTLAGDVAVETLIVFEHFWTRPQRARVLELIREGPPKTPHVWFTLAKLYHRLDQHKPAQRALLSAYALLRTIGNPGTLDGQITKQAKDWKVEPFPPAEIDSALLKDLGFVELTPDVGSVEMELAVDEPANFFAVTDNDELQIVSLRVVEATTSSGDPTWQLAHVASRRNSRSWGTSGSIREDSTATHTQMVDGTTRLSFRVGKIADKPRFRLTVGWLGQGVE